MPADGVRLVVQVGELQAVGLGRRAEVEDPWPAGSREQGVALALVERPVADLRRRDVPDVAGLEQEQSTQLGRLERLLRAIEAVGAESFEVDADLPVDPGDTGGGVVATGNPSVVIGLSPLLGGPPS